MKKKVLLKKPQLTLLKIVLLLALATTSFSHRGDKLASIKKRIAEMNNLLASPLHREETELATLELREDRGRIERKLMGVPRMRRPRILTKLKKLGESSETDKTLSQVVDGSKKSSEKSPKDLQDDLSQDSETRAKNAKAIQSNSQQTGENSGKSKDSKIVAEQKSQKSVASGNNTEVDLQSVRTGEGSKVQKGSQEQVSGSGKSLSTEDKAKLADQKSKATGNSRGSVQTGSNESQTKLKALEEQSQSPSVKSEVKKTSASNSNRSSVKGSQDKSTILGEESQSDSVKSGTVKLEDNSGESGSGSQKDFDPLAVRSSQQSDDLEEVSVEEQTDTQKAIQDQVEATEDEEEKPVPRMSVRQFVDLIKKMFYSMVHSWLGELEYEGIEDDIDVMMTGRKDGEFVFSYAIMEIEDEKIEEKMLEITLKNPVYTNTFKVQIIKRISYDFKVYVHDFLVGFLMETAQIVVRPIDFVADLNNMGGWLYTKPEPVEDENEDSQDSQGENSSNATGESLDIEDKKDLLGSAKTGENSVASDDNTEARLKKDQSGLSGDDTETRLAKAQEDRSGLTDDDTETRLKKLEDKSQQTSVRQSGQTQKTPIDDGVSIKSDQTDSLKSVKKDSKQNSAVVSSETRSQNSAQKKQNKSGKSKGSNERLRNRNLRRRFGRGVIETDSERRKLKFKAKRSRRLIVIDGNPETRTGQRRLAETASELARKQKEQEDKSSEPKSQTIKSQASKGQKSGQTDAKKSKVSLDPLANKTVAKSQVSEEVRSSVTDKQSKSVKGSQDQLSPKSVKKDSLSQQSPTESRQSKSVKQGTAKSGESRVSGQDTPKLSQNQSGLSENTLALKKDTESKSSNEVSRNSQEQLSPTQLKDNDSENSGKLRGSNASGLSQDPLVKSVQKSEDSKSQPLDEDEEVSLKSGESEEDKVETTNIGINDQSFLDKKRFAVDKKDNLLYDLSDHFTEEELNSHKVMLRRLKPFEMIGDSILAEFVTNDPDIDVFHFRMDKVSDVFELTLNNSLVHVESHFNIPTERFMIKSFEDIVSDLNYRLTNIRMINHLFIKNQDEMTLDLKYPGLMFKSCVWRIFGYQFTFVDPEKKFEYMAIVGEPVEGELVMRFRDSPVPGSDPKDLLLVTVKQDGEDELQTLSIRVDLLVGDQMKIIAQKMYPIRSMFNMFAMMESIMYASLMRVKHLHYNSVKEMIEPFANPVNSTEETDFENIKPVELNKPNLENPTIPVLENKKREFILGPAEKLEFTWDNKIIHHGNEGYHLHYVGEGDKVTVRSVEYVMLTRDDVTNVLEPTKADEEQDLQGSQQSESLDEKSQKSLDIQIDRRKKRKLRVDQKNRKVARRNRRSRKIVIG